MRTTLDIDDDILAVVKDLARAEGRTMGQIISDLARRCLNTPSAMAAPGMAEAGAAFEAEDELFPRLPRRGGPPVSNELVRRVQDEIDREDMVPWDHARDAPRVLDAQKSQPTTDRKT